MITIWKYVIQTTDVQKIAMPVGADILTVQTQGGQPCMWVIVDTEVAKSVRTFEVVGTGNPMTERDDRQYIGTYQLHEGALVFHLFEIFV